MNLKAQKYKNQGFIFYDENSTPSDIQKGNWFIILYEDESYGEIVQSVIDDFNDFADIEFVESCKKVYAKTKDFSPDVDVQIVDINWRYDEQNTMRLIKNATSLAEVHKILTIHSDGLDIESIDVELNAEGKIVLLKSINY
jgi:hypothetical protein